MLVGAPFMAGFRAGSGRWRASLLAGVGQRDRASGAVVSSGPALDRKDGGLVVEADCAHQGQRRAVVPRRRPMEEHVRLVEVDAIPVDDASRLSVERLERLLCRVHVRQGRRRPSCRCPRACPTSRRCSSAQPSPLPVWPRMLRRRRRPPLPGRRRRTLLSISSLLRSDRGTPTLGRRRECVLRAIPEQTRGSGISRR